MRCAIPLASASSSSYAVKATGGPAGRWATSSSAWWAPPARPARARSWFARFTTCGVER